MTDDKNGLVEQIAPKIELEVAEPAFEALGKKNSARQSLASGVRDDEHSRLNGTKRIRNGGDALDNQNLGTGINENYGESLLVGLWCVGKAANVELIQLRVRD